MAREPTTLEKWKSFKSIAGYDGPYQNKYLKGLVLGVGPKKFNTLEEALEAANENIRCGGITITPSGFYTLRQWTSLYKSYIKPGLDRIEVTYMKNRHFHRKPQEVEEKVIEKPKLEIIEYHRKLHKKESPENIYEIIIYKKKEYYYCVYTRKCLDLEGNMVGYFNNGLIAI